MNKMLEKYVGLVEFLGNALGSNTEVVLQDMTNLESSVVAIANGHISNREVGAPATDVVLKILKNKVQNRDFLCNYTGTLSTGDTVRSSTYFIKGKNGEIIGMLCINRDMSDLVDMKNLVDRLLALNEGTARDEYVSETFAQSSNDLTLASINGVVKSFNIPPERMSYEEKLEVIEKLNDGGIFLIKGAVSEVAKAIKVSEPTVYRYLGIIKKN